MRHLKEYKIFESNGDIDAICEYYGIMNYTINDDGSIDVDEDINLNEKNLTKIPLKFNSVTGYFYCSDNKLTSLEGSPNYVGSSFRCGYNKLTSLEGSPNYVGSCFSCYGNKKLTSLEGSPKHVGLYFDCRHCELTSLEGSPKYVGENFHCENNVLISIEGCTENIGGFFCCDWNPIDSILKWFVNEKSNTSFIELFNYCDIVQDKNVIYDRLQYFFDEIGIELSDEKLKDIERNGYKIIR